MIYIAPVLEESGRRQLASCRADRC